ncbi:hypothetical protein M1146_02035 [Patescibacteria group bacterium]|nr:hypothetical protein [Patescibacteria group bacterium]
MVIQKETLKTSSIGTVLGINDADGEEYYQALNANTYAETGGNVEAICGAFQQVGAKWFLDIAVDYKGNVIPNEKGIWVRTADSSGRRPNVTI